MGSTKGFVNGSWATACDAARFGMYQIPVLNSATAAIAAMNFQARDS